MVMPTSAVNAATRRLTSASSSRGMSCGTNATTIGRPAFASSRAADRRRRHENRTLAQQLPGDRRPGCAKRHPHRELAPSPRRLHDHQACHVGGGDEQQQCNRSNQRPQCRACLPEQLVDEGPDAGGSSRRRCRTRGTLRESPDRDRRAPRPRSTSRLRRPTTWSTAASRVARKFGSSGWPMSCQGRDERAPGIGPKRVREAAWHHAHHGDGPVIERDRPADDRRVAAECPLPEPVADDESARRAALVVAGRDRAPHRGLDAERREEIARHRTMRDRDRFAVEQGHRPVG